MRADLQRLVRALLLAAIAWTLATACEVPTYQFETPDAGPSDTGVATPSPCQKDQDCAELTATKVCDTERGYCEECVPGAKTPTCGDGLYCTSNHRCAVGCESVADCREGLNCNATTHQCVGCSKDADCEVGTSCQGGNCVLACANDASCPQGFNCCGGACVNLLTDAAHCAACARACGEGQACINGHCGIGECQAGFAECNANADDPCETDVSSDPLNCGRCRLACASGLCAGGVCTTGTCPDGFADCNQEESDRCEADLNSTTSCGMCGKVCSSLNGKPSCDAQACNIACDDGFDNCDDDVDTGCETNLTNDGENCGACGVVCDGVNGGNRCVKGVCQPTCARGWGDCDGDPTNGCETDVTTSSSDCGECGAACAPDNATGTCSSGSCQIECKAGFADCNDDPSDGCEADLSSPASCGKCGNQCSGMGGTAVCSDGKCSIQCTAGHADCINGAADGCETDLNSNPLHCGACETVCPSTVGTAACFDGKCGFSNCISPNMECDGKAETSCETNINTSVEHCGACSHPCSYPNAAGVCMGGSCTQGACNAGFADCTPDAGCETQLGTATNCHACGDVCSNSHGGASCKAGVCAPTCATGWGDCDGNPNNGCETPLNTLSNCGACGLTCSKAHGSATCDSGSCQISQCDSGYGNCDDETSKNNGCESRLNTAANCGGCGATCDLPHASESCSTGSCKLTSCDTGWADCTSAPGCETQLGTTTNCTSCGDACSNNHGTTSCGSNGCTPVCDAGFKSCDGNTSNGCETNIRTSSSCGDCGVLCDLPNATESCSTGTCVLSTCNTGFADCTSAAGCETALGTLSNCRGCGDACNNAHGTTTCSASGCLPSCNAGWESCDSSAQNGCETSIWTTSNCGACGQICDIPNSSESCGGGTCSATSCATGFADCTPVTGCETQLGTTSNCRFCGESCSNAHGTTACGATGCAPSCDAGYRDCDSIPDNGCETNVRTLTDCGGCGTACSFPNATASCSTGSCTLVSCTAGFADCTSAPGCETQLGTATSCATCGVGCTNAHGSNACTGTAGSFACTPSCDPGYADCDGKPENGCETSITTPTNCGGCGVTCDLPNASESCATGTCTLIGCNTGFGDCTSAAGCETALGTSANCAACGNACSNAHGTTSCAGSAGSYDCAPSCAAGWKSCDANPDNGCERSITTLTDCGDCGQPCSIVNGTASCSTGSCKLSACNSGFGDCTSDPGCETALGTTTNCAGCGNACTNQHGSNACMSGSGGFDCAPTCDSGFGDCDKNPDNGCEQDLSLTSNCGACGNVCSGSTPFCVSNQCVPSLTIQLVNASANASSSGSSPLSVNHTLQTTGEYRVVVALVAIDGNSQTSARGTVSYMNGSTAIPFTLVKEVWSGNRVWSAIFVLKDSALPAAGNYSVRVTGSGSEFSKIVSVYELKGVDQTNPVDNAGAATGGGATGNCGTTDPNQSVTTVTDKDWILSTVGTFGTDAGTAKSGQTQTYSITAGSIGFKAGYLPAVPIGATAIKWDMTNCNAASQALIALKPATSP